jgi:hypothetical protein
MALDAAANSSTAAITAVRVRFDTGFSLCF